MSLTTRRAIAINIAPQARPLIRTPTSLKDDPIATPATDSPVKQKLWEKLCRLIPGLANTWLETAAQLVRWASINPCQRLKNFFLGNLSTPILGSRI